MSTSSKMAIIGIIKIIGFAESMISMYILKYINNLLNTHRDH